MAESDKYLLAIDTATSCSTVALTTGNRKEGQVLASLSLSSNITHSRRLLSSIERLLEESSIAREDLAGYAVGLGPGSFTGLRIGMATVKGLAAASGLPLYGISTLDAIAANCLASCLICAVLDARKKEVYAAFYRLNDKGLTERVTDIIAVEPRALVERINEPVLMVGDGLAAYSEVWESELGEKMITAPAQLWTPSASVLGLIAGEMAMQEKVMDLASAVPMYVRASDAELNLQMKKKKQSA